MRLLRLVAGSDWSVELHPFVTVVTGLDESRRTLLVEAARAAVAGRTAGVTGLIEAHGVVLDLDEDALDLLELDGVTADVVVTAADLPGAGASDLARQLRSAERRLERLAEPRDDADAAVAAAEEALSAARAEREDAAAALAAARAAAERLAADVQDARERTGSPEDESDDAGHPSPGVEDGEIRLRELEAALAEAEAEVAALAGPSASAAGAVVEAERRLDAARTARTVHADRVAAELADLRAERTRMAERLDLRAEEQVRQARADLAALGVDPEARDEAATVEAGGDAPDPSAPDPSAPEGGPDHGRPEHDGGPVDGGPVDGAPAPPRTVGERRALLEARAAELRGELSTAVVFDTTDVRDAVDAVRRGDGADSLVPSVAAIAVADRIDNLRRQLEELAAHEAPRAADLDAAARRLEAAEAEVRALEAAGASNRSEADRRELDVVHAELLAATDALEQARFRRARAETRLAEARAAEDQLLDRLGFRTYLDAVTAWNRPVDDPARAEQLRDARSELVAAQAEHRSLQRRLDGELERAELEADLERARINGREILLAAGVETVDALRSLDDAALAARLSAHRERDDSDAALDGLVAALERVGVRTRGLGYDRDDVLQLGLDWLDEHQALADAHDARADELAEVEVDLQGLGHLPDETELVTPDPETPADPSDDDGAIDLGLDDGPTERDLAAARARLASAEQRHARHEAVVEALADLDDRIVRIEEHLVDGSAAAADDAAVADAEAALEQAQATHARLEASRLEAESTVVRLRAERAALDLAAAAVDPTGTGSPASGGTDGGPHHDGPDDDGPDDDGPDDDGPDDDGPDDDGPADDGPGGGEVDAAEGPDLAGAEARAEAADAAVEAADGALRRARADFEEARARHDDAVGEVAALRTALEGVDDDVPVDEVEWYLLARLAAQRDVCFAGSVPLVVDRALDHLDDAALDHVLARLERMAGAVQVIHLSDDERLAAWARGAGEQRAAVVAPGPVGAGDDEPDPGGGLPRDVEQR